MSLPTIRRLPSNIVNRIAAGEVVERPSSVVKELVENAIDAGATQIDICYDGVSKIIVTDDGCGIPSDQLSVALERHATSKLLEDDVMAIHHLGFRGEALPSIASVSELTITSRTKEDDQASSITVKGGDILPIQPAKLQQGTRIEIRNLFFTTPARLKFLKSDRTEAQHVMDMVRRLALAHHHIAFCLQHQERLLLNIPNTSCDHEHESRTARIQAILGDQFIQNAVTIDASRDNMHVTGMVSIPTYHRRSASEQYLFINHRPVRDKVLQGCIRAAYQDVLVRERHPSVVLYLSMPPEMVDVNVHPAKAEVRFRDEPALRSLLIGAIKQALKDDAQRTSTTIAEAALEAAKVGIAPPQHRPASPHHYHPPKPTFNLYRSNRTEPATPKLQESFSTAYEPQKKTELPPLKTQEFSLTKTIFPLGAASCQLHKTYIISQTEDSIIITDQHAAHERLVYEKMKIAIAQKGIQTQRLLMPEMIELSEDNVALLKQFDEELSTLGIRMDFTTQSVIIRETPADLGTINIHQLIDDILDDLKSMGTGLALEEMFEHVYETMACHSSIRAGREMRIDEMNALLREMENTPHSGQCNHGRPTYVELKLTDIEKLFGRR